MKPLMAQWHKLNRWRTKPYGLWLEDRAEEMQGEIEALKHDIDRHIVIASGQAEIITALTDAASVFLQAERYGSWENYKEKRAALEALLEAEK